MSTKVRMGYVGCGFMAQKVHLPNIMGIEECELLALAEMRPQLGARIQQTLGIPRLYASHQELAADASIDAVGVSGHFCAQGEIAIDLLRAGKDVFMEKPMAISVAQAERILAAERDSGKRVMVAYMKRYDAGNLLFKELLDGFKQSGEMGAIKYVRNHGFCGDWCAGLDTAFITTDEPYPPVTASFPDWLPEANQNGYLGYLQQYTHNVNLVRWFLDAGQQVSVKSVDLDANGVSGIVVLDVNGVRVVIESGGLPYEGWDEHTQIYFEKGWMKTNAPPLLLKNVPATVELYRGDQPHKATTSLFPAEGRTWSYREEMRHFVQCVQTGAPFRSPAADTIADVRTFEEIYQRYLVVGGWGR